MRQGNCDSNPFAINRRGMPDRPWESFQEAFKAADRDLLHSWAEELWSAKACVGVIGAGWMGSVVAARYAAMDIPVVLVDVNAEVFTQARARMAQLLPYLAPYPAVIERGPRWIDERIRFTTNVEDLAPTLYVAEFITESLPRKRRLLKEIEAAVPATTPILTGSSVIPLSLLSLGMEHAERLAGVHLFHPLWPYRRLRSAEVVYGPNTVVNARTAAVLHSLFQRCLPHRVPEQPGLLANRLLFAYLSMALRLLDSGVAPEELESATLFLGYWWQPLRRLDEIGLDTALRVGRILLELDQNWQRLTEPAWELLAAFVARGWLGRKSHIGLYRYERPETQFVENSSGLADVINPEVVSFLRLRRPDRKLPPGVIVACLLLAVAEELENQLGHFGEGILRLADWLSVDGLRLPWWTGGFTAWFKAVDQKTVRALFQQAVDERLCSEKALAAWDRLQSVSCG